MKTLRCLVMLALLAAVLSTPSKALPVFARKYGFHCTMCHANFPRLNDYGLRYRQNGYQLPGRENEDRTVVETPAPFAMRTSAGYNSDKFKNTPGAEDVNQFQVNGLDVLSGGLFGLNRGYIFVYTPEIRGSPGVAAQDGALEAANAVFVKLASTTWLNLRAGRFEAEYTAFSDKRRLTVSPYEIYDFSFPSGLAFSETQTGVEFTGYGFSGVKYAIGWVNGAGSNSSDDAPSDVYLRGVKVFGRGEGLTSGQRIGLTGYFGKARPAAGLPPTSRKSFNRFGVDASLNSGVLNLGIQYLRGRDDGQLWGLPSDVRFSGGLTEFTYLPADDLVGFLRYDWVNSPTLTVAGGDFGDVTRWTVGGRYYLEHNIALHVEYSHRRQDNPSARSTENLFTTRLDFAF